MIPLIYETYSKFQSGGKSAILDVDDEIITTKGKGDMTPEEIAQQAAQREAEEQADFDRRMREKEQEMGIHDTDQNSDDEEAEAAETEAAEAEDADDEPVSGGAEATDEL